LEKREMKRNRIIAMITIALLTLSMMAFWIPSVSATPQHRIILPFHTSWENEQPLGRTNAVDEALRKDFNGPQSGWCSNEVAPPEVFGFKFGSRQLKAAGYFGSSNSYCYFNLFDTTPDSVFGPPIKLKPYTFINIWYYHYNLAHCMMDAKLYNKGTGQVWTLRDFNYDGQYIVDQNEVRIHPACRWNDSIGSWQFACFDLSIIYESDPENWYITKIWIGFDNDPSLGDGATGSARTYFDMLYISYGMGDKKEETDGNSYACTSGGITAWAHWLRPGGKYGLYLKVNLRGYIEGGVQCCPWCYCPLYPYTLKVNIPIDGTQAQLDPAPTGVNLRQKNESHTEVGEFVYDVIVTLLGFTPVAIPVAAADLATKFYGLLKTPAPEPTYEFPHSWRWENMSALGEVIMEVPLDPGTHLVQITLSVDYCYYNIWAQDVVYKTQDITLHFPWSSEPDELPVSLSISASSGGTTNPAPGTYTKDYGESVTITASVYSGYAFDYWLLDGVKKYGSSIIVTMNADHTLEAYFKYTGGGGGCPILYVRDGADYVCEGLLDIHNPEGVDVIYDYSLVSTPQRVHGAYLMWLTEHPKTHSYIDQVKLYAILEDQTMRELPLIWAWHSEDGNVLPMLLHSDEWKTDTLGADHNNGTSQSIDLKFAAQSPNLEIVGFMFQIEGVNPEFEK